MASGPDSCSLTPSRILFPACVQSARLLSLRISLLTYFTWSRSNKAVERSSEKFSSQELHCTCTGKRISPAAQRGGSCHHVRSCGARFTVHRCPSDVFNAHTEWIFFSEGGRCSSVCAAGGYHFSVVQKTNDPPSVWDPHTWTVITCSSTQHV